MTSKFYQECGGAQKILNQSLANILKQVPGRLQKLMARLFGALKTSDNTKRYSSFYDLKNTLHSKNEQKLQTLLSKLVDLDILRYEERRGDSWYEFKHDYLVDKITDWLQQRQERLDRRRFVYGISPGVVLLLAIIFFFVYQYNFYQAKLPPPPPSCTTRGNCHCTRCTLWHSL